MLTTLCTLVSSSAVPNQVLPTPRRALHSTLPAAAGELCAGGRRRATSSALSDRRACRMSSRTKLHSASPAARRTLFTQLLRWRMGERGGHSHVFPTE